MKYNFVPVFDTKMKKRRSIAPHLAKDANYLLKMGFELIEGPPPTEAEWLPNPSIPKDPEVIPIDEQTQQVVKEEKPKRGRPKKQS